MKIINLIIFISASTVSISASAVGSCRGSLVDIGTEIIQMGTLRVPKSAPIGTLLKTIETTFGMANNFYCEPLASNLTTDSISLTLNYATLTKPSGPNRWELKNSGIGMSIWAVDDFFTFTMPPNNYAGPCHFFSATAYGAVATPGTILQQGNHPLGTQTCGNYLGTSGRGMVVKIQFYKINNSTSNAIFNNDPALKMRLNTNFASFNLLDLNINGNIINEDEICSVNPSYKSMTVNFGRNSVTAFPNIGSTAAEKTITLPFTCEIPDRKISLKLDGTMAQDLGNNGVLQSSMPGMGVQLLNARTMQPLSIGSTFITNLISDSATTANFPILARYYRTGNITPGPANATATLTINYN